MSVEKRYTENLLMVTQKMWQIDDNKEIDYFHGLQKVLL